MRRHGPKWFFRIAALAAAILVAVRIGVPLGLCGDLPAGEEGVLADIQTAAEKILLLEAEALEGLKKQLAALTQQQKTLEAERSAYRLQLSTHSNLLLREEVPLEDLHRALIDNTAGVAAIDVRLTATRQEREGVGQALERLDEQGALNRNQLDLLLADTAPDPKSRAATQALRRTEKALAARRGLLEKIGGHLDETIRQLDAQREALVEVAGKLNAGIRQRESRMLFERRGNLVHMLGPEQLRADLTRLRDALRTLLDPRRWPDSPGDRQTQWFWRSLFLFLLLLWFLLLGRLRRALHRLEGGDGTERPPQLWRIAHLIRRSLPWLGILALCALFEGVQPLVILFPLAPAVLKLVWIQLLYRWGADSARVLKDRSVQDSGLCRRWRSLLRAGRGYALTLVLLEAAVGPASGLAVAFRIGFGIYLLFRGIGLGRALPRPVALPSGTTNHWHTTGWLAAVGFCWVFPAVGFLLEVIGFGAMALHWQVSWVHTLTVCLWGALLFAMLRAVELGAAQAHKDSPDGEQRAPVRWLALRLGWLVLGVLLVAGVAGAWGGRQAILDGLGGLLRFPIPVGEMRFSLLGILQGALILFATHAATRFWRILMQRRFLRDSGLELGVQASITTITTYLLWGFGLIVALRAFGLNATSLALAFGALGVGLGFGLQAIFNNFVSGLILLFERPIQVGDAVEVGGIWGVVKKINVRSTLVQTYDNASLIIPNSEFISSQVTNWSFKDQRLRRTVSIGVAYGSDVELVRCTLLEIAAEVPEVLRRPTPDVLFADFGDSALIFRLRFWTLLDGMLQAETAIRFAIARRFQALGIEIPFPQQEIRLRPAVAEALRDEGLA